MVLDLQRPVTSLNRQNLAGSGVKNTESMNLPQLSPRSSSTNCTPKMSSQDTKGLGPVKQIMPWVPTMHPRGLSADGSQKRTP